MDHPLNHFWEQRENFREQIYVQVLSQKRTNKEHNINYRIVDSLFLTNTH